MSFREKQSTPTTLSSPPMGADAADAADAVAAATRILGSSTITRPTPITEGGCGGTEFGCCLDETTPARSLNDSCKGGSGDGGSGDGGSGDGGCGGTEFGCCHNGTPARSFTDSCKGGIGPYNPFNPNSPLRPAIGRLTRIICGNGSSITCDEGTEGCSPFSNSGLCSHVGNLERVRCESGHYTWCNGGVEGCYQGSKQGPCIPIGNSIDITCKNDSNISCHAGTYGCFPNSNVGVCSGTSPSPSPSSSCSNPIPENVYILSNNTNMHKGICQLDGNHLVCGFENYCNDTGVIHSVTEAIEDTATDLLGAGNN